MSKNIVKHPWWVTVIAVITALPSLAVPEMIDVLPQSMGHLILIYPLFAVGASFLGWKAYPRRPDLYWIMIVVAWLTFGAMWVPLLSLT
ncbi:MAG: hypothetical protein NC082_02545 [Clostridiales bacterium]|nr:hypothetical protein [Clostridiales bacterium]